MVYLETKIGALVGFACGLDIKRTLLELEKARG
ncbi:MAG: MGMT family protein [Clostridia bacterium]|nr:MGMT family protein [Clostridia bacterium]